MTLHQSNKSPAQTLDHLLVYLEKQKQSKVTQGITVLKLFIWGGICDSYTMGCPPVGGDNSQALASGLSYVQVDKHGITFIYHPYQCRPCTSRDISC